MLKGMIGLSKDVVAFTCNLVTFRAPTSRESEWVKVEISQARDAKCW